MLFSVRLEIVKVWLFSSKLIFRVALHLVLQLWKIMDQNRKMGSNLLIIFTAVFSSSRCVPAALFHVGFDLVHIDLGVQQSGEMS